MAEDRVEWPQIRIGFQIPSPEDGKTFQFQSWDKDGKSKGVDYIGPFTSYDAMSVEVRSRVDEFLSVVRQNWDAGKSSMRIYP